MTPALLPLFLPFDKGEGRRGYFLCKSGQDTLNIKQGLIVPKPHDGNAVLIKGGNNVLYLPEELLFVLFTLTLFTL